jgi:hypothetical protein
MAHIFTITFSFLFMSAFSQNTNKIFTSDIDNFWIAYDSIQQTKDFSKKLNFINRIYIENETKGLNTFMKARNFN